MGVEVRYRAHKPGLQGPKGVSIPLCQRLSIQISRTCRVSFIPAFIFLCIMFINASCVIDLGLEVEASGKAMCGCASLGCRVRVDLIGQRLWVKDLKYSAHRGPSGGRHIGF